MASHLRTAICFALVIPVSLYTYVFLFQTLGLAALPGFFIHGHVIAGSGYRKGSVPHWADVRPPPTGTFSRGLACCTLGLFSGWFLGWS